MEKTTKEKSQVKGQKEKAMSTAVLDAIHEFCIQSEEFAKAVVEGGSFADCMTAVAKGTGNAISDIEAYKKAVSFYLPNAEIVVQMQITTGQSPLQHERPAPAQPILLRLEDFLGG